MGWIIAGAIAAIVGTAVSTYAAYESAAAQRRAAKSEEEFREQEAESIRQAAAYEERQFRRRITLLLGKQRAIVAESGLDPSIGSPLLLELDTVRQAELEALNVRRSGDLASSAKEFEARLARTRASYFGRQQALGVVGGVAGAGSILATWAKRRPVPPAKP